MTSPDSIVCKPTPWFLLRAGVMLAMFGTFAVMFYLDGSTGYRKKNENYYLNKTFQIANDDFAKMNTSGTLTAAAWKTYAATQNVAFPTDSSILPAGLALPMPWPAILGDFEKMKPLQWNLLWREYTKERGLNATSPEEPYNANKIREQWIVCVICSVLALAALYILARTLGRSISADAEAVTTQQGKRVPFSEMTKMDLRKWETKGLAFIDYSGPSGSGKIRLDGLTYGGFKKEKGEPAEQLLQHIRRHFSGEITEYASAEESPSEDSVSKQA